MNGGPSVSAITPDGSGVPLPLYSRGRNSAAGSALLGDQQVATGGRCYGEAAADVALGVGECLQGEAVGDREEEGDDLLGVVAELQHALLFLGAQDVGDV